VQLDEERGGELRRQVAANELKVVVRSRGGEHVPEVLEDTHAQRALDTDEVEVPAAHPVLTPSVRRVHGYMQRVGSACTVSRGEAVLGDAVEALLLVV
jgi:hypothetical protein